MSDYISSGVEEAKKRFRIHKALEEVERLKEVLKRLETELRFIQEENSHG